MNGQDDERTVAASEASEFAERSTAGPESALLTVSDLCVQTSDGAEIVSEVGLRVRRGELLALVGESGCGKTTTGLALLGHTRPGTRIAGGSVTVDGVDVLCMSGRDLQRMRGRRLTYVPQDPASSLNPSQRIITQATEVLRVHGETRPRAAGMVRDLFERVNLPTDREFLRRYPFELSGGQQQRVLIAMALMWRPSVVVLDEPTTGLDVVTQARVLQLVRELRRESGAAFVYVTHDLAVVNGLADHVAVMYAGRIVESGPCDEVFQRPSHPYTSLLLSSVPRLSVRMQLRGQNAGAPPPGHRPMGCAFAPRCARAEERCLREFPAPVWTGPRMVRCWNPYTSRELPKLDLLAPAADTPGNRELLRVEGLVASYGSGWRRREVIHRVSLKLAPGECVALVGQTGSGKSTFGRCIAGLHRADSGSIQLEGRSLERLAVRRSPADRRAIQIVFQNPERSLNPNRRVGDIIGRPVRIFERTGPKETRRRVQELLSQVRLPPAYLHRYPRELSGGEMQRVAIARALAAKPEILVSDEITSALDVSIQAAIVELLGSLGADGLTILFITHNLALVNSIAERVVVLEGGVIREEGWTDKVLRTPVDAYTQGLVEAAPNMPPP